MSETKSSRLQPGVRFRGLLVQSLLGTGAMGDAYLASHPILRIPLVIKIFKQERRPTLFREAHLAARVASPYIVGVVDAGVEDDMPFVVQRYVDGIDLDELATSASAIGRRPPVTAVCRIVGDAARGLHAIHQAGVVHRDVKPANLFLCGDGRTVVGDFGVAIDPLDGEDDGLVGTPIYMAPEQWTGEEIGRATDIYSLGATAHLLATGTAPFDVPGIQRLGVAHMTKPYEPPRPNSPDEAYLFAVVERMLRKHPGDRYPTAHAVARALETIASPLPDYAVTSADTARVGPIEIELSVGDIAESNEEVIVNAANWQMTMEVGVAAAIKRAGGDEIEEEAMQAAPARMGAVVWTGAGRLRAGRIAHAVSALAGSICLQRCTLRVLLGAEALGVHSIAFPALGTGVGEVPMDLAAKLILEALRTFVGLEPVETRRVRIVLHTEAGRARWREVLKSS